MRRSALYLGAILLLSSSAWANPRLSGTLVRMDTKSGLIVIKNEAGQRRIQVQSSAHIEQNGGPSRLGNFHVGDRIEVEIGGTLSNDPLVGVAVYDTATAANLPAPAAPDGVYGQQVGTMATVGGAVSMARPTNAMEGMAMGPNNANLQAIMNQNVMGPGITMPPGGPLGSTNGYPYQPYGQTAGGWQGQGQGQWNQPAPGAFQQPPVNGQWQQTTQGGQFSTNPQQTGLPQGPPDQVPAGQTGSGWTSAPAAPPPAGTIGSNTGWSGNTTPGWSNNGTMGAMGTVDGVIRNIDPARNTLFVAPVNGGETVAVRISIGTTVQNQQSAPVGLNQIRLGSYVHVVGQMAGGSLVARSVNVQQ